VQPNICIIGGGPAGLMAAEQLTNAGYQVDLFEAMPTVGRKLLLAGIGGLNLTHSEPYPQFCERYSEAQAFLQPSLDAFKPNNLREWCQSLGIETFIGTSGRVFPSDMKAAPLLRAWLKRLTQQGLRIHTRHYWQGWQADKQLQFQTPKGLIVKPYDILLLALGGGSWRKLGCDGLWLNYLQNQGIQTTAFKPSNGGFKVNWSNFIRQRFAGAPLKSITLSFTDLKGQTETRQGEFIINQDGVEGSLIYAFSARLRDRLYSQQSATIYLDLLPHLQAATLHELLSKRPKQKSLSSYLKSRLKLDDLKTALVFEALGADKTPSVAQLTILLKQLPLSLIDTFPIDKAISTAGGICLSELDEHLMLKRLPAVFCAGEMLDWEAPTGGYLLTACFATGKQAGQGILKWLKQHPLQPVTPT
jgi:hypothetical protein